MSNLNNNLQPREKKQDKRNIGRSLGCFLLVVSSAFISYSFTSHQTPRARALKVQFEEKEQNKVNNQDMRPIMHTFFEPLHKGNEKVLAELDNWKNAWSDAGWRPVVLTLADAERHHDYQKFHDEFENAEYKLDKYNRMCFYRWLAMAVAGGGWMSDLDTFPLFSNPERDGKVLPNQGKFTCYSRHVPNLVSGSGPEFDRMSRILYYSYSMHTNEFWSDMYAMLESHLFLKNYYHLEDSIALERFYAKELQEGGVEAIVHPYALHSKCELAAGKRVVHFSHADCHAVGFCHRKRDSSAPLWIQAFQEKCRPYM